MSYGLTLTYIWEILVGSCTDETPLKADVSIKYSIQKNSKDTESRIYHYYFTIKDYQTLYYIDAHIEPTKGSEFCRAGALCHLYLKIKPAGNSLENSNRCCSLMYEVVAEQSLWAVCGRTAGVISFESDFEPQTVILDVMPLNSGFLPLPIIRLSKYIPADCGSAGNVLDFLVLLL